MKDDPDRTEEIKHMNRLGQMAKLRIPWDAMGEMANVERALAAGTIQDLMNEVEAWRQAMQKAERNISELIDAVEVEESAVNHLHTDRNNLRLEIERLRSERDEARREACESLAARFPQYTAREIAQTHEWDCYPAGENGTMNKP